MEKIKDVFDPFKAYHDQEPPKVIKYIAPGATREEMREEFTKFVTSICVGVDYTTKRVNVYGVVNGVDVFEVCIFNPLRNPELIQCAKS